MATSIEILEKLIAFKTVSRTPNIELIEYVRGLLEAAGVGCRVLENETGTNANLYASTGPTDLPGVMLSGHTDVVPVEGQSWTIDPFRLTERDGLLYGRGTADMKAFVACAIAALVEAADRDLSMPLHLALSYDEEIGCIGVRHMLGVLAQSEVQPRFCIVGEPTSLGIATGHKGKTAAKAVCTGREAHSSLAPQGLNALHLAADFIGALRDVQEDLEASGVTDGDYDVPWSTVHAGVMAGGTALNIVPNRCVVDFEIRNIQADDPDDIMNRLRARAEDISKPARERFADAGIEIEIVNAYPGLDTAPDGEIVAFMKSLTGANSTHKVAFGTEGGLMSGTLGVPTVVCGPGSMNQGHKPDEYVSRTQLDGCDALLGKLVDRLTV